MHDDNTEFERVSADSVHIEGRTLTVGRLIHAPAADIFELLADPEQQIDADGTEMIRSADEAAKPITAVGDEFTMNMYAESMGGDYRMINLVTKFEEDRVIAWKPRQEGYDKPLGWQWTWELEPEDDDTTYVTLTYDWEEVTNEKFLEGKFPPFPIEAYTGSLEALADAVEDDDLDDEWEDDEEALSDD